MGQVELWFKFVVAVLATWRVAYMLSSEDGPGDCVVRLRRALGDGFLGKLMDCFYCLSVWIALPLAFYVVNKPVDLVVVWLAISGGACVLYRSKEPCPVDPVIIQPAPSAGKEN